MVNRTPSTTATDGSYFTDFLCDRETHSSPRRIFKQLAPTVTDCGGREREKTAETEAAWCVVAEHQKAAVIREYLWVGKANGVDCSSTVDDDKEAEEGVARG